MRPTLKKRREIILLGGDTNSGKSYQWALMARKALDDWRQACAGLPEDQWPKCPRFFIIDTDDTTSTMLNEGDEFEDLYHENGGNVYPFPAFGWMDIARATNAAAKMATRDDWIVADVVNRFYDTAQDELASRRGYDLADKAIADGLAPRSRGFNGVEPGDWLMIRRIHDSAVNLLIHGTEANFLALCHLTDVSDVAGRERREILTTFDEVGLKPMGAPRLPGSMHTIVFLWSMRRIQRDEKNKRVGQAKTVRYLSVIKDRGAPFSLTAELTGPTFYEQLRTIRRTMKPPTNITEAQAEAEGLEPAILPAEDED